MSDWFDGNGSGKPCDAAALLDTASDAISELVSSGALVSVGVTSDGGALGFTVTLDGRWRREYFRDGEPMLAWLLDAVQAVKAAPPRATASPVPRERSRGRRGR